ncbi:sulfotransferase family 2 domain-containing protein [Polynucleobacter asymbioticus]|jgi:hypothetical protein|uniref:sulfotransferase family 2 domain-containing protein n=1 Tax=Polynucleobacter asymbioticus TaxID=576611 RepID=UPI0018FFF1E6|nr:sulfotransferase family 2 domain-containing protein [Polynucleobacter asymbioticus]
MHQLQENTQMMFAANHQFDGWVSLLNERHIYEQGRNTSLPLHPAHYWTHVAGKQIAHFIGKVENFESDFAQLAKQLDLGELSQINSNTIEPNAQSSFGPVGYRYVDRMSASSIQKINLLFKDDFELFGYPQINA